MTELGMHQRKLSVFDLMSLQPQMKQCHCSTSLKENEHIRIKPTYFCLYMTVSYSIENTSSLQ